MAKYRITVDTGKCRGNRGCELKCMQVCPTKVIAYRPLDPADPSGEITIQATHPLLCNGCMACVHVCEPGALSIADAKL